MRIAIEVRKSHWLGSGVRSAITGVDGAVAVAVVVTSR